MSSRLAKYLLTFFCFGNLVVIQPLSAQTIQDVHPFPFDQITNSYPYINPAKLTKEEGLEVMIGYNNFNKLSNEIYTVFTYLSYTLNHNDSFHQLKLGLNPEKEGKFINRARGYLGYSFSIPLNQKLYLSSGINIGYVNYTVQPNVAVGGSSGGAIDGNFGLSVFSEDFYATVSANQVVNSQFELYFTPLKLARFFTLAIDKKQRVSKFLSVRGNIFSTINADRSNLTATGLVYYMDKTFAGVSIRHDYGLIIQVGVEKIRWQDMLFSFSPSYRLVTNRESITSTNRIELVVGLQFDK